MKQACAALDAFLVTHPREHLRKPDKVFVEAPLAGICGQKVGDMHDALAKREGVRGEDGTCDEVADCGMDGVIQGNTGWTAFQ